MINIRGYYRSQQNNMQGTQSENILYITCIPYDPQPLLVGL